jgi:zinc protease
MILRFLLLFLLITQTALAAPPNIRTTAREITTPYGLKAWLLEEHSLPIISLHLAFKKAGHAYDPQGKEGIARMAADLLDDGAGGLSGSDFQKRLENSAITLNFDEDDDNFYVTVKSLTENFEEALNLLNMALTAPAFDAASISRAKSRMINVLAQKNSNPETLAELRWKTAYYLNSAYAKSGDGTNDSITSITQPDLQHYVRTSFTRANMVISVAGDITGHALKALLDQSLADLPITLNTVSPIADRAANKASLLVVDKSIPQSVALFGQKGLPRSDPDFYALFVLNYILGGGSFESRLMKSVREEKGLAYSVYSFLSMSEYSGILSGYVATKNSTIYDSLAIIKAEMRRLKRSGVTEAELRDAKNYLMLSFPLKFDKTEALAEFLTMMQLYQLGIDFLNKRNDYVENVTLADINRVAKKVLDPDQMTVVIIGNKKEMTHE